LVNHSTITAKEYCSVIFQKSVKYPGPAMQNVSNNNKHGAVSNYFPHMYKRPVTLSCLLL